MATYCTAHARARMQQRGIPGAAIEALLAYGRTAHDHHGGELVFFDKAARARLFRDNPSAARDAAPTSSLGRTRHGARAAG